MDWCPVTYYFFPCEAYFLCSLWSSGRHLQAIPVSLLKTKGEQAFTVKAPQIWDDLPDDLSRIEPVSYFKSLLET